MVLWWSRIRRGIGMNEIEMLQTQLRALFRARDYLLHQQPTDISAATQVTEKIVALSARSVALVSGPPLPPLSPAADQALRTAVKRLENNIAASAAVAHILEAAHAVANLSGEPTTLP